MKFRNEPTVIGSVGSLSTEEIIALPDASRADPFSSEFPDALRNRYTREEAIGHGGFGDVWRAFDERMLRTVAIKIYKPDPTGAVDAHLKEARTMAPFSKESRVGQVFECGKTPEG